MVILMVPFPVYFPPPYRLVSLYSSCMKFCSHVNNIYFSHMWLWIPDNSLNPVSQSFFFLFFPASRFVFLSLHVCVSVFPNMKVQSLLILTGRFVLLFLMKTSVHCPAPHTVLLTVYIQNTIYPLLNTTRLYFKNVHPPSLASDEWTRKYAGESETFLRSFLYPYAKLSVCYYMYV